MFIFEPVNPLIPTAYDGSVTIVTLLVYLVITVAIWKMFTKAGHPGILALIPIVNIIYLVKIAGYPWVFALLLIVPLVNIVFAAFLALNLGQRFGEGPLFSIMFLWILAPIGYLIIGFGQSKYQPKPGSSSKHA